MPKAVALDRVLGAFGQYLLSIIVTEGFLILGYVIVPGPTLRSVRTDYRVSQMLLNS